MLARGVLASVFWPLAFFLRLIRELLKFNHAFEWLSRRRAFFSNFLGVRILSRTFSSRAGTMQLDRWLALTRPLPQGEGAPSFDSDLRDHLVDTSATGQRAESKPVIE